MTRNDHTATPSLDLAVRVGCELVYETEADTPVLVSFKPRQDLYQMICQESVHFEPLLSATEFEDDHENIIYRLTLQPGRNVLKHDAMVMVPHIREDAFHRDEVIPPHLLPASILRYTLPTRYCDTDKLLDFAWEKFGQIPHGLTRVRAICDWLHRNIEYRS
jgi:transglutaminase-like putative cysteine protease